MPALRDVPKVPAHKERPQVPTTARLPTNYSRPPKLLNNLFKNTNDTTATILERSKRKEPP